MALSPPASPTAFPEVNTLLKLFLEKLQPILRDHLVGFYLYGSLSLGDFDPDSSDVDFLVVTEDSLSENMLAELRDMHVRIAATGLLYSNRLEGSYIPRTALRRFDPQNAAHPTIGVDWDFQVGQHGSNWIIERHIVRERGMVVWGPSPKDLIDPVSPREMREAVCEMLLGFWQTQLATTPEWLRPREYQAFAILTMCRALYTLNLGTVVSKPEAAAWAVQNLDAKWRPIIQRALIWRHEHTPDNLTNTLDFIRFAVAQAQEDYGQTRRV